MTMEHVHQSMPATRVDAGSIGSPFFSTKRVTQLG
jgi:hypothetical protein